MQSYCYNTSRSNKLLWLLLFVPVVFFLNTRGRKRIPCYSSFQCWRLCRWRRCAEPRNRISSGQNRRCSGRAAERHPGNLTELVIALQRPCMPGNICWSRHRLPAPSSPIRCSCSARQCCSAGSNTMCRSSTASAPGCRLACCFLPRWRYWFRRRYHRQMRQPATSCSILSLGLSILLIAAYALSMLFSLVTHRQGLPAHNMKNRPAKALATTTGIADTGGRDATGGAGGVKCLSNRCNRLPNPLA